MSALVLSSVAILTASGLMAWLGGRWPGWAGLLGVGGAVLGTALGGTAAVGVLLGGPTLQWSAAWNVPLASLRIALDPLSALFLLPWAVVGGVAAVYGRSYLAHGTGNRNQGRAWLWYNLLLASMLLVFVARNGVLFLVSWELMSLASFFLVLHDDADPAARQAGWMYLVATHLGTAFLLALFAALGRGAGSLDFDQLGLTGVAPGVVFVLALIGFGTKAGFVPLHVWLPEAHPAAPSHVSAVMSGVMIKTGIYGLLRVLTLVGPPPPWWGWTLLCVGALSGVLGVLWALAQHDLKRVLAYSSVENVGLITIGLGLGLLGMSYDAPLMAGLGLAGAMVHVVNHAVLKSLLFLGAGAVVHATGTRRLDQLGGLLRRMPRSGRGFLLGAVAICGLPPLNGFVGEVLLYAAAFAGVVQTLTTAHAAAAVLAILAIGGLAIIGGLAAACFARVVGSAWLGEPRSPQAAGAREVSGGLWGPMLVLAATCMALVAVAPWMPAVLKQVLKPLMSQQALTAGLDLAAVVLRGTTIASLVLVLTVAALALLRRWLLAGREVASTVTWDCGYAAPTPRMQYTASSFGWPAVGVFAMFVRPEMKCVLPAGLFPAQAALATDTPDGFVQRAYRPLFAGLGWVILRLRWLQHGRIQFYVLYIALTLLALLVWKLG